MSRFRTLAVLAVLAALGCGPINQLPTLLKDANTAASSNSLKQLLQDNNVGPIDTSQVTVLQNQ